MTATDTRQRLRDLKALEGPFDPVDFGTAPDNPQALFLDWLDAAIAASFTPRDGLRATWTYRALIARNLVLQFLESAAEETV